MSEFPLTPNGKIDRTALAKLAESVDTTDANGRPPLTETEKRLALFWLEIVDNPSITLEADRSFFDMGGDSLKLVRLHSLIEKNNPGHLKIVDLFKYTTLSQLAARLDNLSGSARAFAIGSTEF
jgi:hypothetical protein